jgi:hypothetical protein
MYVFPRDTVQACTVLIVVVKNTANKVTLFRKPGAVKAINHIKCKEGSKEGRKEVRREKGRMEARGRKSCLIMLDI